MTQPINLNKARKARARVRKQQQAAENRVKHGRTKAEKVRGETVSRRQDKHLDAVRRDDEA